LTVASRHIVAMRDRRLLSIGLAKELSNCATMVHTRFRLAGIWRSGGMLRIGDGPDDVQKIVIARHELARFG
jgi:hypothetical protein